MLGHELESWGLKGHASQKERGVGRKEVEGREIEKEE
jgi:hypothetical protein